MDLKLSSGRGCTEHLTPHLAYRVPWTSTTTTQPSASIYFIYMFVFILKHVIFLSLFLVVMYSLKSLLFFEVLAPFLFWEENNPLPCVKVDNAKEKHGLHLLWHIARIWQRYELTTLPSVTLAIFWMTTFLKTSD